MKKIVVMTVVLVLLLGLAVTSYAATSSDIVNYAKQTHTIGGKAYTIPASEVLKIERYFNQYPISSANADTVIAKLNAMKQVMTDAGVSSPSELSKVDKDRVIALANEAAGAAGATLTVNGNTVNVYKEGVLIEAVTLSSGKLIYTGNTNMYIAVVAIVGLAVVLFAIKKVYEKR